MPSFPPPSSVTICEINRHLITADAFSDDIAKDTYAKLTGLIFRPVEFQADDLRTRDGGNCGDQLGRNGEKGFSALIASFKRFFHPNDVHLLPKVNLQGVSWHQHKHIMAFISGSNQVTIRDYEDSEGKDPSILHGDFQQEVKHVEWRPNSGRTLSVACKGGICIWAASYPGNPASVRPGAASFVGAISKGSGMRWTLVDFLKGHDGEHISALSWSPDGRYPCFCHLGHVVLLFFLPWLLGLKEEQFLAFGFCVVQHSGRLLFSCHTYGCGTDTSLEPLAIQLTPLSVASSWSQNWNVPIAMHLQNLWIGTPIRRGLGGISMLKWSPSGDYFFSAKLYVPEPIQVITFDLSLNSLSNDLLLCSDGTFYLWETVTWTSQPWSSASGFVTGATWDPESRMILLAFSESSTLGSVHFASKPPSLVAHLLPVDLPEIANLTGSHGVEKIAWDGSGERLAVSFKDGDESYQGLIAIYDVRRTPLIAATLFGFIRGPGECPKPLTFSFHDKFKQGPLLSVIVRWNLRRLLSPSVIKDVSNTILLKSMLIVEAPFCRKKTTVEVSFCVVVYFSRGTFFSFEGLDCWLKVRILCIALEEMFLFSVVEYGWLIRSFNNLRRGNSISPLFITSIMKRLESANAIASSLWWAFGFYWIVAGGPSLLQDSPRLYWLAVVFLALDVFFMIFFIGVACIICVALFCCVPIVAIVYAMTIREGASVDDIRQLPKYTFHCSYTPKMSASTGSGDDGDIDERDSRFQLSECCICLTRYGEGDELCSLPCNHHFHFGCISKWLRINAICPLCKFNIKANGDALV
ncbi:hypothetical protein KSS87_000033 [Heliosperma pusillum]|nr:hypothetical protein KSS87_000033 [Heliosperma pusillum]